jgi:hypothetical protein
MDEEDQKFLKYLGHYSLLGTGPGKLWGMVLGEKGLRAFQQS